MRIQIRALTLGLTLVATLAVTPGAQGVVGKINQDFLNTHIPLIEAVVAEDPQAIETPMDAYRITKVLLETRKTGLAALNESEPLTTFNGALTQDVYDDVVLRALGGVLQASMDQTQEFPPEFQERFARIQEAIPALGETPVAFMVLTLAQMAVTGGDSLMQDSSLSQDAVATFSLGLIRVGWNLYEKSNEDLFARAESNKLRQSSVIYRMRCPEDGGVYAVTTMKNKINADNSISILYYLQCELGGESIVLAFPQELTSRLNQLGEYQKLKRDVKPSRPDEGLDP